MVENASEPIPQEILENLFEPLRRYSTKEDETRRNLGLGLFIVREIARAHGGEVKVAMPDGFVNFQLLLPRASGGQAAGCLP